MTISYQIYDDHWTSKPIGLGELRAELEGYVRDVCDGDESVLVAAVEVATNNGLGGDVGSLEAAESLIGQINAVLDSGTNGLVIAEACHHCAQTYGEGDRCGEAEVDAVWYDDDGETDGRVMRVCRCCFDHAGGFRAA